MEGADVVTPGPTRSPDPLHIRKNTQKSKFLLSHFLITLSMKLIVFVVRRDGGGKALLGIFGEEREVNKVTGRLKVIQ